MRQATSADWVVRPYKLRLWKSLQIYTNTVSAEPTEEANIGPGLFGYLSYNDVDILEKHNSQYPSFTTARTVFKENQGWHRI